MAVSDLYRFIPRFWGKKRLGYWLFGGAIHQYGDKIIPCRHGLQFHILNTYDSVGRDLFFDGIYEPATIRLIQSLLSPGDVVIDAGANIGAISLPLAAKNNITLFAFEPARDIFKILGKNIALNRLQNVSAVNQALSDESEDIDFYESDRVHGWSGPVKINSFNHYKVPAMTLDQFALEHNIDRISVLKADVQGWEYHVFKGAQQMIRQGRIDNIVFEFEWWAEENAGLALGTAQRYLMDEGYAIHTLDGKRIAEPLTQGSVMLWARRVDT